MRNIMWLKIQILSNVVLDAKHTVTQKNVSFVFEFKYPENFQEQGCLLPPRYTAFGKEEAVNIGEK